MATQYEVYRCQQCGFEYDEAEGFPDEGFPPGTLWSSIPENWVCPDCGLAKANFRMVVVKKK